jgi:hypothetical protein
MHTRAGEVSGQQIAPGSHFPTTTNSDQRSGTPTNTDHLIIGPCQWTATHPVIPAYEAHLV